MPPRLDVDALDTDELFARGVAAARVGEAGEARALLVEVTARRPHHADAWLWLAGVESEPRAKRASFERVLALRPDDPEARAGLDRLAQKYGRAVLQDEPQAEALRCHWHSDRETGLRCTRCGRPMCPGCARSHPVGWRCRECAKELRSPLYKVTPADAARGLAGGLVVSTAAAGVIGAVGAWFWFIVTILLTPPAATLVADGVARAGRRKRGSVMQSAAAAAVLGGALLVWLAAAWGWLPRWVPVSTPALLLYAALGAAVAYARLR